VVAREDLHLLEGFEGRDAFKPTVSINCHHIARKRQTVVKTDVVGWQECDRAISLSGLVWRQTWKN
jgi:hypothetical protein